MWECTCVSVAITEFITDCALGIRLQLCLQLYFGAVSLSRLERMLVYA